ncbi:GNAT family N-acetyltransferase [Hanstruepera ponticola]|uniref:GNAT family N-acetyltransferase n=1 Tax=Hanstruepera ponticola TaxID=2042995 RepID=UPI000CF0A777|nr:GNAT family N-acetyltransferase [Hanstruepera ponticola]
MEKESNYIIQLLDKSSKKEVSMFLELLQSNFSKSTEYYRWKHNLDKEYEVEEYTFCIYDKKLCVATIQMIVNKIVVSGKDLRFALLCDGATHKDYRRYGIFERMLNKCVSHSKTIDVSFVYSTGNEKSRRALMKLGYQDFFSTFKAQKRIRFGHNLLKPINIVNSIIYKIKGLKINGSKTSVKEIDLVDYHAFINSNKGKFDIYFDKSLSHLKWRLDKPEGEYTILGTYDEDQVLRAATVLQLSTSKIYIVDFLFTKGHSHHMNKLLQYIVDLAWRNKGVKHINVIRNNFDETKSVFNENGFNLSQHNIKTLLKYVGENKLFLDSDLKNMHYMRIDKNE